MKFSTYEEMAKRVAETALDDFEYQGKSIREWIKIIAEQEPCEDAISRQAVLDYIGRLLNQGTGKKKSFGFIQKYVEKLPSVTPQYTDAEIQKMQELEQAEIEKAYELGKTSQLETGHWIPVSERLPKYGEAVITINEDEDYKINHVIDEDDGEWLFDGTIAWMPLPEPYKAESEVEDADSD